MSEAPVSVFICYSHDDSEAVYEDIAWLQAQDVTLWYDQGISAGSHWRARIGDSLLSASHLVFFVSSRSLASDHCNREVNLALDEGKAIVPVYLEDVELTPDLKVGLARVQALYRFRNPGYRDQLLRALSVEGVGSADTISSGDRRSPMPLTLTRRSWVVPALAAAIVALSVPWAFHWFKGSSATSPEPAADTAALREAAFGDYLAGRALLRGNLTEANLDTAKRYFEVALRSDPALAPAQAGLCEVEILRDIRTAASNALLGADLACMKALSMDESHWAVQRAMGMLLARKGAYDEAMQAFERALAADASRAEIHGELGWTRCQMGGEKNGRLAHEAFSRAIDLEPGYWGWRSLKGSCYYRQAEYVLARAAFEQVLKLTPENRVRALNNLALTQYMLEDFEAAEKNWRLSLDLTESVVAHDGLGVMYYYQGCPGLAAVEFDAARALSPSRYRFWGNLGETCALLEGQTQSARYYQRAIALANQGPFETHWKTAGELGLYYARTGSAELAREQRQRMLDLNPDDGHALFLAYHISYHLGDADVEQWRERSLAAGFDRRMFDEDPTLHPRSCPQPDLPVDQTPCVRGTSVQQATL